MIDLMTKLLKNEEIIRLNEIKDELKVTSCCSYDNDSYISGHDNGIILIKDMNNQIIKELDIKHNDSISKLFILDNKSYLISGSKDKSLVFWKIPSFEYDFTLHGHTDSVRSIIQLSKNEIITCGSDRSIIIWNILYKEQVYSFLKAHLLTIYDILLFQKNTKLISISYDDTFKIWNYDQDKEVKLNNIYSSEKYSTNPYSIHLLSEHIIIIGFKDGCLRFFNTLDYKEIYYVKNNEKCISGIISTSYFIYSISDDGLLCIYDKENYSLLKKQIINHKDNLRGLIALNKTKLIAIGIDDYYTLINIES